jgi:hypothetical protein
MFLHVFTSSGQEWVNPTVVRNTRLTSTTSGGVIAAMSPTSSPGADGRMGVGSC